MRRFGLVLGGALLLYVIGWLTFGGPRSDSVARGYFAAVHSGQSLADVSTQVGLFIPPLWSVTISGQVHEPGKTFSYLSTMILLVEPLTGFVILNGSG